MSDVDGWGPVCRGEQEQELYRNSVYLPLNFAVNLKLF